MLPVAGAILWGAYQILIRLCSRTDTPDTTLVWSAFVAFGATTLIGPWQWRWPDATGWALLVAIASLGALAHYALIKALDYAEAELRAALQLHAAGLRRRSWASSCSATSPTTGPSPAPP